MDDLNWTSPSTVTTADDVLLGLAEYKRLREVEQLARELADCVFQRGVLWNAGEGVFYCNLCRNVARQAGQINHLDTCLITRVRRAELLETNDG